MDLNKTNLTEVYFSDDEDKLTNDLLTNDSNDEDQSDDSLTDETRQLIYDALENKSYNDNDNNLFCIDKKNKKVYKQKNNRVKTSMTLKEFAQKIAANETVNKPKFISKRVKEKKDLGIIKQNIPKRTFNPRLPPYNHIYKVNKNTDLINFNNNKDFPVLK
jgi:hypothetical protein